MKNEDGQTLIEVLAAFGIAVVLVSAITIVVISALYNAQFSKNQNLATQYSQQGMEIVRKIRDSNFTQFNLFPPNNCLDKDKSSLTPKGTGCGQNVDVFVREVTINKELSSSCSSGAEVTVSTSWSDSKCTNPGNLYCHSAKQVSCLSSAAVPTPGTNRVPPALSYNDDPNNPNLSWTSVDGAAGYIIYYCSGYQCTPGGILVRFAPGTTSFNTYSYITSTCDAIIYRFAGSTDYGGGITSGLSDIVEVVLGGSCGGE